MNVDQLIRAVQAKLSVEVDGQAGPQTWKAIYETIVGKPVPKSNTFNGKADARSEGVIANLQAEVAPYARALVQKAAARGIEIKIISGYRSYDEQNQLYAQSRTRPGKRVTNAKGGESNHNFGIAFDIGVFEGSDYLDESPNYDVVGGLGMELGLSWGGNWQSFQDRPHYELRPDWAADMSESEMLAELRERVAQGRPIFQS